MRRACRDGVALRGDGRPIAAGRGAGESSGASRADLRQRGARERLQRAGGYAGGGGEFGSGDLQRDERVRGQVRGRVVGGAIFLGDVDRQHAQTLGQGTQHRGVRRVRGPNRCARALEGAVAGRDADERVQHRAASVSARKVDGARAARVDDQSAGGDARSGLGDRAIRHAQHDDLSMLGRGAAPERGVACVDSCGHEGPVERGAKSAGADHREARESGVLHCRSSSLRMPVAICVRGEVVRGVGSGPLPVLAASGEYTPRGDGSTIRRVTQRTSDEPGAELDDSGALTGDSAALRAELTAPQRREQLAGVFRAARECTACPQLAGSRTQVVFGGGNADADLMLIGEAPGAREDELGTPFVGAAGRLLDELLASVGVTRADVFITKVLKCRPPGNRDPAPTELARCRTYLDDQIALVRPRVIATLGSVATKALRPGTESIGELHGRVEVLELDGLTAQLVPLYHPAAALYTRSLLDTLRDDVARLAELLARPTVPSATA